MRKKASIQLSVNFLVMLILAIIVFSLGVTIFFKELFPQANKLQKDLDASTKEKIMNSLVAGAEKVVIPFNSESLDKGERHVFGIGIRNDISNNVRFLISVTCKAAYRTDKSAICSSVSGCSSVCGSWVTSKRDIKILKGERKLEKLFFIVPKTAISGNYIFNVDVKYCTATEGCKSYDTIKKIYINVK